MKKIIKKISAYFQTPTESFRQHNSEYEEPGRLEFERKSAAYFRSKGIFDSPEYKLGSLLKVYPAVRALAVDIGSGSGWLSADLAKYFDRVIGIEPSAAAIHIAGQLYSPAEFPNIEWRQGFAEAVLSHVHFETTALLVTGVVLSHLRDQEVEKICQVVNEKPLVGSILGFNECWGQESHRLRWHVRTKQWWEKQLSNWDINFHSTEATNEKNEHMGFHAVKVK